MATVMVSAVVVEILQLMRSDRLIGSLQALIILLRFLVRRTTRASLIRSLIRLVLCVVVLHTVVHSVALRLRTAKTLVEISLIATLILNYTFWHSGW